MTIICLAGMRGMGWDGNREPWDEAMAGHSFSHDPNTYMILNEYDNDALIAVSSGRVQKKKKRAWCVMEVFVQ